MIAEVIVDISNSEVDRVFDYSLEGSARNSGGFSRTCALRATDRGRIRYKAEGKQ